MNFIEKKMNNNIIMDISDENVIEEEKITKQKQISETPTESTINYKNDNMNELQKCYIKQQILFSTNQKRPPSCGLIVIDNFYQNAMETRNFVLKQNFAVTGNYPGKRTISYATPHLKEIIQKYVEPFSGKITEFPIPKPDKSDSQTIYNGAFQYTVSRDRSWVHTDSWNNWAGVLFLTPDAPLSGGTGFYRFKDGTMREEDSTILKNKKDTDNSSQDMTKWELVDKVANVFNRLILFDARRYHMSLDYFGDSKENGRLFQVFFFSTEKQ